MPVYTAKDARLGTTTQPASGTIRSVVERAPGSNFFTITYTLTAARMTVTDAAGSGSYGTLSLLDLPQTGVHWIACRQNYTAFAEGSALTTAAGDAAFKIGVGSTAIAAAADVTLATAEKDIGGEIAITLSSGTGVGTAHTASNKVVDGTSTATKLNLNWSGSAATIDATSTIDITGTITVAGVLLGDD